MEIASSSPLALTRQPKPAGTNAPPASSCRPAGSPALRCREVQNTKYLDLCHLRPDHHVHLDHHSLSYHLTYWPCPHFLPRPLEPSSFSPIYLALLHPLPLNWSQLILTFISSATKVSPPATTAENQNGSAPVTIPSSSLSKPQTSNIIL